MKTKLLLFALVLFFSPLLWSGAGVRSQTSGEWTWMHGDNTPNSLGVFGTQGVASPTNKPPALYEPCEWKDNNGNFWLLGGAGVNVIHAALWKFDPDPASPTYNQWAWMKGPSSTNQPGVYGTQGVPSVANYPGARRFGVTTWTDASGNFWLFGGEGFDALGAFGKFNDLWKYDPNPASPTYNQWTWMKGPNTINNTGSYGTKGVSNSLNLPASRYETSCSWTDNAGDLWLYGGKGDFGDLWKYSIASNNWTWIQGSNTLNASGVYGTQGAAAPANTPGGRWPYCSWKDLAGNFWLFGGLKTTSGELNDLWKYDIISSQWAWMKGPNTMNDPGNYGAKCVTANTNMPPARGENRARVRDACGNFWNFGGEGISSPGKRFNDLWHYNVSTNNWTWVSGDNIPNQAAVYGTKVLSNPANKPGAKSGSVAWIDNTGYIWVFGGQQKLSPVSSNKYNDLFRYVPDSACVLGSAMITISSNVTICSGQGATLAASGGTSYTWSPGGQTTSSIVVNPTTSTTYTVIGNNACGSGSSSVTITVAPTPSVAVSSNTSICIGQSATLAASGGISYSWSPGGQSTSSIVVSPGTPTTYTVTGSNSCGSSSSLVTVSVNDIPSTTASSTNVMCSGGSDGTAAVAATGGSPPYTYLWNPAAIATATVTDLSAGSYTVIITDSYGCSSTQMITIEPSTNNSGELYLPDAFSPNNDGENDDICLQGGIIACLKDLQVTIYDRWGEQVFKSKGSAFCWDGIYKGNLMNTSVFVYYLNATLLSGEKISKKGNMSLIK